MKFFLVSFIASSLQVTYALLSPTMYLSSTRELQQSRIISSPSSLYAIGVLARKAKEADVRKYCETGIDDDVMEQYKKIKDAEELPLDLNRGPGPLQSELTRRKGTVTVIAEYKRKIENGGFIVEVLDPELLSPTFRKFGASAIAVMADERMGGCTYQDLADFVEEQRRARHNIPGSVMVVNNDLIVDEIQIARTAALGVRAIVLILSVIGEEKVGIFLKAAQAVDLEAIVAVSSKEEAQKAIDLGARMLEVVNVEGAEAKYECVDDLQVPEGVLITRIANIAARNDKGLDEIEEAWHCRDKGFNAVWISDVLYKNGMDSSEHPGAIIKSMKAKSSLRFASPKARAGKGEGAREYLGDILM
jgi:indole-3-glycerol phosphate synthase